MAALKGSMFLLSSFLFVIASLSLWTPAVGYYLSRCEMVNQTVYLEKEGCPRCYTVETTICRGHCPTKDPVRIIPFPHMYQDVCTYRDFSYHTVVLPDCLLGVDPVVSYPVAKSCHCSRCSMDTSDCTFESQQHNFCLEDIPLYK